MMPPLFHRTCQIDLLNDQSPKVTNPDTFKMKLKEHQKTLIAKCIELENEGIDPHVDSNLDERYKSIRTNIGIIGDKTGSGNTLSICGLIQHNETPKIVSKITQTQMYGHNNVVVELKDRDLGLEKLGVTLIVVPHSIIKQWKQCIINCFPPEEFDVVNTTKTYNALNLGKLRELKVLLVSGTFYKRIQEKCLIECLHLNRIVFDECDSMNTPNAKHIPSNFYWFVSASYKNILSPYPRWNYTYNNWQNNYQISSGISNNAYAKNIFMGFAKSGNPLMTRVLHKIVVKNEDSFVESSFELPEMNVQMVKCRDSGIISILNGVVHSNIINCLNAGDVDGAVSYINQDNVDTEVNIIEGVLQGLTIKLTNINTELRYAAECIYVNEDIRTKKIDKLTKEKDELESKMLLIRERIKATDMCTICLEKPRVKTITKCCNNSFCFECLASWLRKKTTCPLCKQMLCIESDLYVVKNAESIKVETSTKTDPTKLQFLQNHLSKITKDMKILIFSENDNSFVAIEKMLSQLQINYAKLKGISINRVVDEYKNGALQVLLVNSNSYGSGLNLENTTDCILLHKFDNEAENQVLGRAQRPGRTKPLNVIYLLNNNEMQQI